MYWTLGNGTPMLLLLPRPPPKTLDEFRTTETLLEPLLAVATSSLPSALKSAVTSDCGLVPTVSSTFELKVPSPPPSRTEMELSPALPAELLPSETTKSG